MNDRLEQPKDYVVHVCQQTPETRYERVKRHAKAVGAALLIIALVLAFGGYIVANAARGDAAVHASPPVCVMDNATTGYCPSLGANIEESE